MNKLEFTTKEEFKLYLKKNIVKEIGFGSEGTCYLLKDGKALKVYEDFESNSISSTLLIDDINPEDIIMYDEVQIENFLFPEELIFLNGKLRAYKTKYIPNNYFNDYLFPQKVNFEKLIDAYYDFLEKTIIISKKNNICFYDLNYNLLFDNKKLYAHDTIQYEKKENALENNINSLRYAIFMAMNLFIERANIMNEKPNEKKINFHDNERIEEFLKRVKDELDNSYHAYQFTKKS